MVLLEKRPWNPSEHATDSEAIEFQLHEIAQVPQKTLYSASLCPYKDDGSNMTGSPVVVSVPVFPLCNAISLSISVKNSARAFRKRAYP